jgi:hypothetical protein
MQQLDMVMAILVGLIWSWSDCAQGQQGIGYGDVIE